MRVLKFILKVMYPFRWYIIGPVFVMLVEAVDASLTPYLTKLLTNAATISSKEEAIAALWKIAPYIVGLSVVVPSAWRFYDWCAIKYEPKLKTHIVETLVDKVSMHSHTFFQNNFTGSIATKINDVAVLIEDIIRVVIMDYIRSILTVSIAIYALWHIHPWFALAMGGLFLFITLISLCIIGKFKSFSTNVAEISSKVMGNIVDVLGNMLSIRLFAAKKHEIKLLDKAQHEYVLASQKRRWFLMKFYTVQGFSLTVYQSICLVMLIHLYSIGNITPGDFTMIFTINFFIFQTLWQMSDQMRSFSQNWGKVDQALKLMDIPIEIEDKTNAKELKVTNGEVSFKNVLFHYKGADPLFQNKSITIKAGQKVGLVGYSGSGKTTFVSLILRLYDINDGSIAIDGQDIKDVTQDSLRAQLGMIPQDPSLFHRSIMENIRYGRLNATDKEVIDAAKRAHAHEFIKALPEGYNALVGERGIKLSGGQRQRIAIARAVLKNAPILILDEATSQLDSVTEGFIQESLWQLMQGKTALVIAHRLSTLLQMDRILVFNKGKIVEDGTHKDLIAKNGMYKSLWDAQVGGFLPENK